MPGFAPVPSTPASKRRSRAAKGETETSSVVSLWFVLQFKGGSRLLLSIQDAESSWEHDSKRWRAFFPSRVHRGSSSSVTTKIMSRGGRRCNWNPRLKCRRRPRRLDRTPTTRGFRMKNRADRLLPASRRSSSLADSVSRPNSSEYTRGSPWNFLWIVERIRYRRFRGTRLKLAAASFRANAWVLLRFRLECGWFGAGSG